MGKHFGTKEGNLYYTLKHGLVQFDELPDWYGIEGIKFQFINTQTDPRIWYKGRDCSCYDVENTMWDRWLYENEDYNPSIRENDYVGFERYMLDHAEEVKGLCDWILFPELHERATTEV